MSEPEVPMIEPAAVGPACDVAALRAFRALFPVLRSKTYLSICDKMILARPVRAGVTRFLDHLGEASALRTDHEQMVASSRVRFARLMRAHPDEIAVTRNVSDGMNAVAGAFPFRAGDNVILCLGAEHPNNIYPWLRLRQQGVEVRLLSAADGRVDIDEIAAIVDDRTRVVTVASVSFCPGERTDLPRLAALCGRKDIFLAVDGVQSAGILDHDLDSEGPDCLATSTSKGLLGLYGYGFLYVRRKWLDRLTPNYLSRTSVAAINDDASAMSGVEYRLQGDARRFELGSYNLAGAYAADASLEMLLKVGTARIEGHVLSLADTLREALARLDLPVHWPQGAAAAAHIVTCGQLDGGGHGYSTDPRIEALFGRLSAADVVLTIRRGQLRFGLHGYNNAVDIARVADICKAALSAGNGVPG
jgi:cysteine desulfurase/selenocysteine lyase